MAQLGVNAQRMEKVLQRWPDGPLAGEAKLRLAATYVQTYDEGQVRKGIGILEEHLRAHGDDPLASAMWEYLADNMKQPGESKDEAWNRFVQLAIPLRRPQTPADIGKLAVYLATAENVTGQAINVDGGMVMF